MEQEILNFSRIEDDPFADLSLNAVSNSTNDIYVKWNPTTLQIVLNYLFFFFELVKFFLGIGAVLADILLIYLILRYKRLRKNPNLYIVHYAIMNMTYFIFSPIFLIIHALFDTGLSVFLYLYCFVGMTEVTSLFMTQIFALCLGLDWMLTCFYHDFLQKFPLVYKYKFSIIYSLFVFLLVTNSVGCNYGFEFSHLLLLTFVPVIHVVILSIHYYRKKRILTNDQLKTEYALWIASIAVFCYAPIYAFDASLRFFGDFTYNNFTPFIFLIEYMFSLISTPGPIYVVFYLLKWNKHIKMAYDTTFKKSVRTYGADNLDDASDNEEIVDDGRNNKNVDTNNTDTHTIMVQ